MKKGYKYEFVQCCHCGAMVAEHWLVRHVKSGCKKGGNDANYPKSGVAVSKRRGTYELDHS